MLEDDLRSDDAVDSVFAAIISQQKIARGRLTWWDKLGVGYYPLDPTDAPYDEAYFDRYAKMADTEMGHALNMARGRMVERHWQGDLVDIGIGSGSFIEHRPQTWGYDINPAGVEWLHRNNRYWNPWIDRCAAVSMWDVLEHMVDFPDLLRHVSSHAFVAIPVFADAEHVHRSRHFRPTEHCWYFTDLGFKRVMYALGWDCVEVNWNESVLGRDCIRSFAFARRHTAEGID